MSGFASVTGQRVETEYNSVVCSILLKAKQHTAANTYNIFCVSALISYLDVCTGFPVIVTWINAIILTMGGIVYGQD